MKVTTKNSDETKDFAAKFSKQIKGGDTILLFGDLGAGKTTFVQGFAQGLGVKDRVLSPTFVLQRIHEIPNHEVKNLNHLDLYRLENPVETDNLGLIELFNDLESITIIEWSERLKNFFPRKGYKIILKNLGENEREINIIEI